MAVACLLFAQVAAGLTRNETLKSFPNYQGYFFTSASGCDQEQSVYIDYCPNNPGHNPFSFVMDDEALLRIATLSQVPAARVDPDNTHLLIRFGADSGWGTYIKTNSCGVSCSTPSNFTVVVGEVTAVWQQCWSCSSLCAKKDTYNLPPPVCKSSCDADEECYAFSVDSTGQQCVFWTAATYGTSTDCCQRRSFVRIN
eukprot:Hpha_TRINITY_DN34950_c0_g1::TRINITY_DN34950_c0_g1_i1::g.184090::m.184090